MGSPEGTDARPTATGFRRTIFTHEVGDRIIRDIEAGNYLGVAAEINGISRKTVYKWIKRGAQVEQGRVTNPTAEDFALAHFSAACAVARAKVQDQLIANIREAAKKDYRAAAWFLERAFANDWGEVQKVELSGPDGGPMKVWEIDMSRLPPPKPIEDEEGDGGDDDA